MAARPLLLVSLLLAGCATTPQVTAVIGPRHSEGDRDVAVTVLVTQMIGKHVGIGGAHQSEPLRGEPFNDRPEETSDSAGIAVQFGGKAKHR